MILREKIYFICYNNDYHNRGKIADLISVVILNKNKKCYYIQFDDFTTDYVEIATMEQNDWHMVTLDDLLKVGMPQ
jgi:hypothetical protein